MENKDRSDGVSIDGSFSECNDPKRRSKIIKAVIKLQKEIGPEGYRICSHCGIGICGDEKSTPPEYIARYCKGDCKLLGLGDKE